jgi:hypothetical protein
VGTTGKRKIEREQKYYKIYEQIWQDPWRTHRDIARKTKMSRNTVRKYLKNMYAHRTMKGPYLSLKSASNRKEVLYLMQFSDPFSVSERLKGFPHILTCVATYGRWNTMVKTDRFLDFSQLVGFRGIVYEGVQYETHTSKSEYTTWAEGFEQCNNVIEKFTSGLVKKKRVFAPDLDWEDTHWNLFHIFRSDLRKKITPTIKKAGLRYEDYTEWRKTLETHCTIHTEFYPAGCIAYTEYCFLFYTDYEEAVKQVLSSFPTTTVFVETGDELFVHVRVLPSDITRLFQTIYKMKTKEMITDFVQTAVFSTTKKNRENP